ncbi:MAG: hypothetical protein M1820_003744 [Bogoriella megaspora]|nr:MAG: hypothetical protein M1820_003744 [Bogoriella megaspora]
MGQEASVPIPGATLVVIGAGLSRTGTASFSRALEILLGGPVYHGGTQTTLGPEAEIKSWISILSHWPPRNFADKYLIESTLIDRLDGYVAVTDAPASGLVPELMEAFPHAKVICTTRDPIAWEKSMVGVSNASTMWFLRFVLFPLPSLRFFVDYINVLREQWFELYHETEPHGRTTYNRHIEWLEKTVPKDRLVFFNVKDGWEPLCKALGKEVPEGVPFPRINDGEAIDAFAKKHVQRGINRWAAIFSVAIIVGICFMMR